MKAAEMKKAIATSDTIYVVKGYYDEFTGMYTLHVVDDFCNEYTAHLYSTKYIHTGWNNPETFSEAIIRPYSRAYWSNLEMEAAYHKHRKIA